MTLRWCLGSLLFVLACGGGSTSSVAPSGSAKESVRAFMEAAADSNLTRMGTLWGTAEGSAAETGKPDQWQRRVAVMHAYLAGTTHRVLTERPGMADNQRIVQVEVARGDCTYIVPVTAVRSNAGGWLVNALDLESVGTPGRGCDGQRGQ